MSSSDSIKKPINCLIIEDQDDDAVLLAGMLRRNGFAVNYQRVETLVDLKNALESHEWDIVFSDHAMPTMNGMDALETVRAHNQHVPFIFVSGTIGEDLAVEAMRTGAQDYIMKDNLKRLVPAVKRELRDSEIFKAQREAEQRLYFLSHYDSLTGLPNRFHFIENLKRICEAAKEQNKSVAVMYIDIDRFKAINDSLGYEAGNLLLQEVAARLNRCARNNNLVSRLASDEFALIYDQSGDDADLQAYVQSVYDCIEQPYFIRSCSMFFSSSVGVSIFPDNASNATDLLGNADIATYRKKDEGGRGVKFYDPAMSVQLEERLALEQLMHQGMEKNEFYLVYQPQIDLSNDKIVGVEALLRWNNAQRGLISPCNFIPLAEETGFILPLSEWVLNEACKQVAAWHKAGFGDLRVAVNISARQFHESNLPVMVERILQNHQLTSEHLELEITESAIVRNIDDAVITLEEIKKLGIKVALDDFGTGYSSLSYLKSFKTDYLKIDQSFIRELTSDKSSLAIVTAIIAMAEKLSLTTIAEGVETKAQLNMLKIARCNLVQGYYLGKPVSAESIVSLLKMDGPCY